MMIKASGRSALILAAGLFVRFAGPLPAMAAGADSTTAASKSDSATTGKSTKQSSRHSKRDENRKPDKAASKSSDSNKAADGDAAAAGGTPSAIPPSVANANARLNSDAPADNANAMTAKVNTLLTDADKPADAQAATDSQVVASDELNDVDRALQQSQSETPPQAQTPPSTQPQTVAVAPVKATSAAPVLASSDSSTWDQTSLIGKIFIAVGALLTMASAARMFMA
jgi:hypothetical protein